MLDTIQVKTLPGQKCPKEGRHRDYITDDPKGEPVPDTTFYRRLIAEGSLSLVDETAPAKPLKGKEAYANVE